MAGFGHVQGSAVLLRGIFYQPFSLCVMGLAALVVWGCPDTWEWSENLTWPKTSVFLSLFCLAIVLLVTQAYQPFIYFIF
jgi:alginate O-acetyltransferase complex protein AlgI